MHFGNGPAIEESQKCSSLVSLSSSLREIGAGTIAEIAKAIARRGTSSSELTALKQQVERYAASLDDAHATLADQAAQLAELQERVDFAERLLAHGRDRSALGAGSKRE